jgi:hypothetical protein
MSDKKLFCEFSEYDLEGSPIQVIHKISHTVCMAIDDGWKDLSLESDYEDPFFSGALEDKPERKFVLNLWGIPPETKVMKK